MAALRRAVSPDFTYSQSYLSLLSSTGCMTGVICCTAPSILKLWRSRRSQEKSQDQDPSVSSDRSMQAHEPGHIVITTEVMVTFSEQEEGINNRDMEKASDSTPGS